MLIKECSPYLINNALPCSPALEPSIPRSHRLLQSLFEFIMESLFICGWRFCPWWPGSAMTMVSALLQPLNVYIHCDSKCINFLACPNSFHLWIALLVCALFGYGLNTRKKPFFAYWNSFKLWVSSHPHWLFFLCTTALSNVPNPALPLNNIEDDLEFATPFPSSKTSMIRSASPDYILGHVRKKSTKQWRLRIARIHAKKKLKKVVSERRKKIREKCKKAEEGRRRAC